MEGCEGVSQAGISGQSPRRVRVRACLQDSKEVSVAGVEWWRQTVVQGITFIIQEFADAFNSLRRALSRAGSADKYYV